MSKEKMLQIDVNDKMEIVVDQDKLAHCMVQDVTEHYLGITVPVYQGRHKFLERNVPYEAIIHHSKRLYGIRIQVTGVIHRKLPLYRVEILKFLGPIQRRQNVRVEINLSILFVLMEDVPSSFSLDKGYEKCRWALNHKLVEGTARDLSAGGINFISEKKIEPHQEILIFLKDDDFCQMIQGQVRRRTSFYQGDKPAYNYGVQFIELETQIEDSIVKYVFDVMRQKRKKQREEP